MAVFFAGASVVRASVWWGEAPEGSNRLTEALGNAGPIASLDLKTR